MRDNFNEEFIIIVVVSSYHTLLHSIQQNRVSLYYISGSWQPTIKEMASCSDSGGFRKNI